MLTPILSSQRNSESLLLFFRPGRRPTPPTFPRRASLALNSVRFVFSLKTRKNTAAAARERNLSGAGPRTDCPRRPRRRDGLCAAFERKRQGKGEGDRDPFYYYCGGTSGGQMGNGALAAIEQEANPRSELLTFPPGTLCCFSFRLPSWSSSGIPDHSLISSGPETIVSPSEKKLTPLPLPLRRARAVRAETTPHGRRTMVQLASDADDARDQARD